MGGFEHEEVREVSLQGPVRPGVLSSGATAMSSLPRAELSSVAWVPGSRLIYDEWRRQGARLGVASRSSAWWIGDWVRYGAQWYGPKYVVAARVTGYDDQTLMNMVYVGTRFEVSRRRENLSWSHHAELAALGLAEQERWLDRAAAEKLSIRALRRELAASRAPTNQAHKRLSPDADTESCGPTSPEHPTAGDVPDRPRQLLDGSGSSALTCPRCGYAFDGAPATGADARARSTCTPGEQLGVHGAGP
jgi:hypothetical protein